MKVTFIGAGAWGAALGKLLHEAGHEITLWDIDLATLAELRSGRSPRYLPEVSLPTTWRVETDWQGAVVGAECVVLAVPSKVFRHTAQRLAGVPALVVSVTKGIEYDTGETMCQVLRECLPRNGIAALSGPTFALEVARGIPTAIVCASEREDVARTVQSLFHRPTFRVYRCLDLLGVELGGALKNVIAIGAGVCDGLGYGDNSKAALVTRAIAEMRRFGVARGASADTFSGLSGLGDLTVTCFSRLSRNRSLGERLGRSETMEAILASAPKLAEGYPTARAAVRLARSLGVDTPIMDEVHAMLYEAKPVAQAVQDLLGRALKAED
jgi:glycerol-3-phosphate dehydrogenase (NAD(P)+)